MDKLTEVLGGTERASSKRKLRFNRLGSLSLGTVGSEEVWCVG